MNAIMHTGKFTLVTWGEITPFTSRVFLIKHSTATSAKQLTTGLHNLFGSSGFLTLG